MQMLNRVLIFTSRILNFTKQYRNSFVITLNSRSQSSLLKNTNTTHRSHFQVPSSKFWLYDKTCKGKRSSFMLQARLNSKKAYDESSKNAFWYIMSGFVIMIGVTYASVPLFKMFCESQGIDVNTEFRDKGIENLKEKLKTMVKQTDRQIEVKFDATTSSDLLWKFSPSQDSVTVAPGETSLAFFRAKNCTDRPIIGIATYTILPYDAGLYFNKIQCFCFEEQRLEPNEEVDMPVLFYLDDQYARDPKLENINQICLSYTFFESKGSEDLANLQKIALEAGLKIHKLK